MKRAVIVADRSFHVETAQGSFAATGFEAVTVPTSAEARVAVEAGTQVVIAGVGPEGWSGERARPLAAMPAALRRGCVVVLVGESLVTGDGARAFLLGVDLVVRAGDLASLGELASKALAAKRALVARLDPAAASRLGG